MRLRDRLAESIGFDWDAGNIDKNWKKHKVSFWETEELFFNQPIVLGPDVAHSMSEERFFALGKTDAGRLLLVVFTFRGPLIRIVSVRDMSAKERRVNKKHEEKDSEVQD